MEDKIKLAKINEAYHRKQMEYFQEEIKILEDNSPLPFVAQTNCQETKSDNKISKLSLSDSSPDTHVSKINNLMDKDYDLNKCRHGNNLNSCSYCFLSAEKLKSSADCGYGGNE